MRRRVLASAIALCMIMMSSSMVSARVPAGWWMTGTFEVNARGFGKKDSSIVCVKIWMNGTFYAYNNTEGPLGDLCVLRLRIDQGTLTIKFLNGSTIIYSFPGATIEFDKKVAGTTITGSNTTRIWTIRVTDDIRLRLKFVWDSDWSDARICGLIYGTFDFIDPLTLVGLISGRASRTGYGCGTVWDC